MEKVKQKIGIYWQMGASRVGVLLSSHVLFFFLCRSSWWRWQSFTRRRTTNDFVSAHSPLLDAYYLSWKHKPNQLTTILIHPFCEHNFIQILSVISHECNISSYICKRLNEIIKWRGYNVGVKLQVPWSYYTLLWFSTQYPCLARHGQQISWHFERYHGNGCSHNLMRIVTKCSTMITFNLNSNGELPWPSSTFNNGYK
jgi:hypothetical protein